MLIKYLIDKTVCYLIRRGPITLMLSAPSSHHRRVSSGEWWRDPITGRNTYTGHHHRSDTGQMDWETSGQCHQPITSLIGIQRVFIGLNLLGSEFFVQGGDRGRGIQKHLEGMYLVISAIYQPRLQTSDVLSWTQVFHCQHGHMTHTGQ